MHSFFIKPASPNTRPFMSKLPNNPDLEGVNKQNTYGQTQLHIIIENEKLAENEKLIQLKELINKGADPTVSDGWGDTPLIYAARKGYEFIVNELLNCNVNVDQFNVWGRTALYMAACNNHFEIVKALLAHKANPWLADELGDTPSRVAQKFNASHELVMTLDNAMNSTRNIYKFERLSGDRTQHEELYLGMK